MSTYIQVTGDSSGLVARVKQVQHANRESQLETRYDEAVVAEIKTANQEFSVTPPTGGLPDVSVSRRPAAQRGGVDLGNAWVAQNWANKDNETTGILGSLDGSSRTSSHFTSVDQEFYIGSGDGTQWRTISYGINFQAPPIESWTVLGNFGSSNEYEYGSRRVTNNPQYRISYADLVLPAGGENFVYIAMLAKAGYTRHATGLYYGATGGSEDRKEHYWGGSQDWDSVEVFSEVGSTCRAFVCNRKAIREISISGTLQGYLNVLNPAPEYITFTEVASFGVGRNAEYSIPSLVSRPDIGYIPKALSVANLSAYSPDIYWYLNTVLSFNSAVVNPSVAALKATNIISDVGSGGFQAYSDGTSLEDLYNDTSPSGSLIFGYKKWTGTKGDIDPYDLANYGASIPSAQLRVSGQRQPLPASVEPPNLLTVDLLSITDGGAPGYCRSNLELLGIPASDHRP